MESISALLILIEGNPQVTGGFPSQRAGYGGSGGFFDASLNKRPNEPSRCCSFDTPRRWLWSHCNDLVKSSGASIAQHIPCYHRILLANLCPLLAMIVHNKNTWWRHQMEAFSALLDICAGNSPVTGEFSAQSPVTRSFDVFLSGPE